MRSASRGQALLVLLLLFTMACGAFAALLAAAIGGALERDQASDRALLEAREALIAHAVDRPIDTLVGPGYLPCPDLDGDGWAESTCGSLSGDTGQAQRLGFLPWKTLGLPDLRDGAGERLWYAVATKYKGLLNCGASAGCIDLSPPAAVGTLTVKEPSGVVRHDGTRADPREPGSGAIAVIIAPGPPLARAVDGQVQRRNCAPAPCGPGEYLDAVPGGEGNDAFVDRNDARRALNRDGFIAGPVIAPDGSTRVNDRVLAVTYSDLMPRLMRRVALEAAHCLRAAAAANGSLPHADPACGVASWGRVPYPSRALEGCTLASATEPGWWHAWRPFVAYAPALACGAAADCISLVDGAGRIVSDGHRFALTVSARPDECAPRLLRCNQLQCPQAVEGAGLDVSLAVR